MPVIYGSADTAVCQDVGCSADCKECSQMTLGQPRRHSYSSGSDVSLMYPGWRLMSFAKMAAGDREGSLAEVS